MADPSFGLVSLSVLLRHIRNNQAATLGAKDYSITLLQEDIDNAESINLGVTVGQEVYAERRGRRGEDLITRLGMVLARDGGWIHEPELSEHRHRTRYEIAECRRIARERGWKR